MGYSTRILRTMILVSILVVGMMFWSPLLHASARNADRQITDVRTDRLGEFAVDDAGESIEAITSADPFGANRRHEYQIVRWARSGHGRPSTRFGGMGESISVTDDGRLTAFTSTASPTGRNRDGSLELFVKSVRFPRGWQLTSDDGPDPGQVSLARMAGSGNRVAFVSSSDPLGANPSKLTQLFIIGSDGRGLAQLTHSTEAGRFLGVAISDDAERLVFSCDSDLTGENPDGLAQVFRVDADGSGLEQLAEGAEPDISGNGSTIVAASGSRLIMIDWESGSSTGISSGFDPSITDDGGWLYYAARDGDNVEIFRRALPVGTPEQLTSTEYPIDNREPVVSGANSLVVFSRSGGDHYSDFDRPWLMQMNPDGSQLEPLVHMTVVWENWQPDITPDGEYVAHLGGPPGTNDIVRMRADGSESVRLTQNAVAAFPGISGDGQTIVFESWEDLAGEDCGIVQVFTIQADGTGLRQLSDCTEPFRWASQPAISSDGLVVYQSFDALYVVPAGAGTRTEIVADASRQLKRPRISDDGSWVVYASSGNSTGQNPEGSFEIFRIHSDGTDLEQITDAASGTAYAPDLSADGSRVVYVASTDPLGFNPDGNMELFLYVPATGERRQLTDTTTGNQFEPRIDGAGRYAVFLSNSPLPESVNGSGYDIFRVEIDTGRISRVTGQSDPRQGGTYPGGNRNNPDYSINDTGGIVFGGSFNSTGKNPDLNSELWWVAPPVDRKGRMGTVPISR